MRILTLHALAFALLVARPVAGQTPQDQGRQTPQGLGRQTPQDPRPYRGLFGGGVGKVGQLLAMTGSVGGGVSQRIQATSFSTSSGVPGAKGTSAFGQGSGGLDYSLSRPGVGLSASFSSAASYYPARQQPLVATHSGSLGGNLSRSLSKRTHVTFSEHANYRPVYLLAGFPALATQVAQVIGFTQDLGTVEHVLTTTTAAGLQRDLTRRLTASFGYDYTWSQSGFSDRNLSAQHAMGDMSFGITKSLGLRLGYGYTEGFYGAGASRQRTRGSTIDAGLDFNRALSLSRRVTLAFSSGIAVFKFQGQTRYELVGDARLNREIGRTWDASLSYNRSVGLLATFRAPVVSDALTVDFGGLISRRLEFHSGAGASTGNVGLSATGNGFKAFFGSAGLAFGLTRLLGLGIDYSYYRYDFGTSVQLPSGLLRTTARQSVNAHLNVWVPLISRTRRPDASR